MIDSVIQFGTVAQMKTRIVSIYLLFILFIFSILVHDIPITLIENSKADLPIVHDIKASSLYVCGGTYIYIQVNASDSEDPEDQLTLIVEYRYGSESWKTDYITGPTIYEPQGWMKIKFEPSYSAIQGDYDFRAKVMDTDGNISKDWVQIDDAVTLTTCPLTGIEDISLSKSKVYRGESFFIYLNASDLSYPEWELIPLVQYSPPSGGWNDIPFSNMSYDFNKYHWVISLIFGNDAAPGEYKFRGRVYNRQTYSNKGHYIYTLENLKLKNHLPTASNLWIDKENKVKRGDSILISADGEDVETHEAELTPYFEYRASGKDWDDTFLNNLSYDEVNGSWKIAFSPPADDEFTLGNYDFRVWFVDRDGDESNIIEVENFVEVLNIPPIVNYFIVHSTSGYRLDSFLIIANGSDEDQGENGLIPIFQYKTPTGDWISVEDNGSYFQDSPNYYTNHWMVMFQIPANAELGQYSFRVQFFDGNDTSEWMLKENYFTLKNYNPYVNITTPEGVYSSTQIIFTADASDEEDFKLSYLWDFGDGVTSKEESPIHQFDNGGTYIVTITVMDRDGGTSTDRMTLTISLEDKQKGFAEILSTYIPIILIVLAILTAVISFFTFSSINKKKNNKGKKR
ncbi:MAG: PKD domain-containing protein [Thermoplasmata archaeon]|nr:MAG: PKD domain-containing protein [Thermoplasmata archaeon]